MSRERAELSKKNPYHIPRYRYYELKYFCRQYDDWKKALTLIDGWQTSPNDISGIIKGCPPESPTERIALSRVFYSKVTKRCAKCGAVMHNVSVARKYCDFCRFGYATNDPVLPLVHPKYTGPTLQEIMREATKEGLQYAEYCKKHGLH